MITTRNARGQITEFYLGLSDGGEIGVTANGDGTLNISSFSRITSTAEPEAETNSHGIAIKRLTT